MNTVPLTSASDVFAWMDRALARNIKPGLERMEWALERLDHPQRRLKYIHVAGTNGKGSTAAMIDAVLREAGYPTGMFISPYVTSWRERIRFDGEPIPEESFVRWANELRPLVGEMAESGPGAPTPFEFWTLLAILYFAHEACPWFVVWETGLGGRLDSTNVVWPLVSVITTVGMEHREWLGDTVSEIAREKAGIIKAGVPVICGETSEEALSVIAETAKNKQCDLYVRDRDFAVESVSSDLDGHRFHFRNVYRRLEDLRIPLAGAHQLSNAAVAAMTLEILRQRYATVIDPEHFQEGLAKTDWPGRLEKVSNRPMILLDGAHNPDGMNALAETVRQYGDGKRIFVVAVMKDKDVRDMLRPIADLADLFVATQVGGESRSLPAEELAAELRGLSPDTETVVEPVAENAVRLARGRATEQDLITVAGSLFLVAEVRPMLVRTEEA
ncbi:bifunctional folylpolyglutamate synthase/dihydrofolate synthase [Staphylospora marina]|uniref:bifunctional folylpolyglutamate synthase/dihydrofolate synthase n=1 Tax=Staphylospora marina TaxID=2490858 RepID=UPI0013DDDDDD|nr:folylpolyglutamate synthase/dihydrofolate synthase family protein [Staphylospora marina]